MITASNIGWSADLPGQQPHSANPILSGYFADPSIVQCQGHEYIYATIDPWGGETLGSWESADFKNWIYHPMNWPTKQTCTSPTSKSAMVWAPSVVRAANGKFFMYVSVGSEVWVGTAEQPLGPWHDANGGQPLILENFRPGYHMIDAEAFMDEDGTAYLYWGSGWNWVNGKCWAVKLKPDMVSFDGAVKEVTPANYFEAPFMLKHAGRYYLMYSSGKTIEDTYQVHYSIGASPLGPFIEATNSPILVTDVADNIRSPGHHAVFSRDGYFYILYHRHSIPFNPDFIGRQVCVDELKFTPEGLIEKVVPTHTGPAMIEGRAGKLANLADPATGARATASSQRNDFTRPTRALDDNFATLWVAATNDVQPWLQLDLGRVEKISRQELRFEYAWKKYTLTLDSSRDAREWTRLVDFTRQPATGSPVVVEAKTEARYLRLNFSPQKDSSDPALFEWSVR